MPHMNKSPSLSRLSAQPLSPLRQQQQRQEGEEDDGGYSAAAGDAFSRQARVTYDSPLFEADPEDGISEHIGGSDGQLAGVGAGGPSSGSFSDLWRQKVLGLPSGGEEGSTEIPSRHPPHRHPSHGVAGSANLPPAKWGSPHSLQQSKQPHDAKQVVGAHGPEGGANKGPKQNRPPSLILGLDVEGAGDASDSNPSPRQRRTPAPAGISVGTPTVAFASAPVAQGMLPGQMMPSQV